MVYNTKFIQYKMTQIEINSVINTLPPYCYKKCDIPTVDYRELEYKDFFEKFMLKNLPCIIKNISCMWECSSHWIRDGTIDYEYLIYKYGDLEVPVADCDNIDYNSHCKRNMKVSDYMNYLRTNNKNNTLYLKDWHLRKVRPDDNFYNVPVIFGSDWLNEYADDKKDDDFRFVYIGPRNSWTPLHADVYSSYSWSVNIFGRKKWTLFPPGAEDKLRDSLGNLPLSFNPEQFQHVEYYEIIQEKGEAIFVPSGWHHQVVNLLDTISINHNFINACNIQFVWNSLQKNLQSVEKEIEEFKDTPEFQDQCQLILKSLFGMNFVDFLHFIVHIAKKRIAHLDSGGSLGFNSFYIGMKHRLFDLNMLLNIINLLEDHPLFKNKFLAPEDITDTKNAVLIILKK